MKLIIFPGGSDPNHDKEKIIYDVLKESALKRKFSHVEVVTYLGHYSHPVKGVLSVKTTIKIILDKLSELEYKEEEYIVVTRSFGCYPFLEVLKKVDLNYCKKVTLWGAPPYYLYQYYFNEHWDYIKENAVSQHYWTSNYFNELIPIEVSIAFHLKDKIFRGQ